MIDEGYTKYVCTWERMPPLGGPRVEALNDWRNRLHRAGLIGYYEDHDVGFGNVSVRADDTGAFIISATQTGHIETTDASHYAVVTDYDIDGNRVTCGGPLQASSEALTHAAIYELDPAIGSVVHVHSRRLWEKLMGAVPTTDPGVAYGTPEMAYEFRRLYGATDFPRVGIAVMAGHDEGIVTFGADIVQAARRILRRI